MSIVKEESDKEDIDEEELAQMYGYSGINCKEVTDDSDQVKQYNKNDFNEDCVFRNRSPKCGYIQPLPSQILTVYLDEKNTIPFHIELDSGATVSYIREEIAHKYDFKILPNKQISKLGDGRTKLIATGEIKVPFFRNSNRGVFYAIVCKNLTSDAIGGTNFIKENAITQDFVKDVIYMDCKSVAIQPTHQSALMSAVSIFGERQVNKNHSSKLLSFKSRVLLPGQDIDVQVPNKEGSLIAIEPWENNKNPSWPDPQMQNVVNGSITLSNMSNNPIYLGTEV